MSFFSFMISKNDFLKLNCSENENEKNSFKFCLKNNVKEIILNTNNIEKIKSFDFYILLQFKFNNFICLYYSIKLMKDVQIDITNNITNTDIKPSITFDLSKYSNIKEFIVRSIIIFDQFNDEPNLLKINGITSNLINFIMMDYVTNTMILNHNSTNNL